MRVPRSFSVFPGHSVHKVWRGHNKEWNLGTDSEKAAYLEFMNEDLESGKYEAGSELNALTLMSNHGHEISKVQVLKLFSDHMRRHHSRYGRYFNSRHNRSGKVAEDRPHTTAIDGAHFEMITTFYVHANPLRANIVKDLRNYHWSTHRLYAFGIRDLWARNVKLPNWYLKLGKNRQERQRQYRRLFARYLKEYGTTKKTFLKRRFFGPISWIEKNERKISEWRKEYSPP